MTDDENRPPRVPAHGVELHRVPALLRRPVHGGRVPILHDAGAADPADLSPGPVLTLCPEPVTNVATPEEIATAIRLHAVEGEVEIDGDARVSRADEGTWVQAWVWIPAPGR